MYLAILFMEELLYTIIQSYIDAGIITSLFLVIKEIISYKENKKLGFHLFIALIAFLSQTRISILTRYETLPNPWLFLSSITLLFLMGPMQYTLNLRMFDKFDFKSALPHF